MESILKTVNLSKTYKNKTVVNSLNLNVNKGEIYGFIGQNGAGKTTVIRMILGLIKPSGGHIELFGEKVRPGQYSHFSRIGSIVETAGFYSNLTAVENLELHRRMMGIPDKNCIEKPIEVVGLYHDRNKKTSQFSLGMRQRLGIARALLYQPEFLVLDEPTNGLDPVGIKEIRELMIRLSKRDGMTIFTSSHILSEVQQIASTIGIIHKGKLIEQIDNENFQKKNRQYVQLRVSDEITACFILEETFHITNYRVSAPGEICIYDRVVDNAALNCALFEGGVNIRESYTTKDTLEQYFVQLIGDCSYD